MSILAELAATVQDARATGDLWGHLQAWAEVALGRVRSGDRVQPAPTERGAQVGDLLDAGGGTAELLQRVGGLQPPR